jgi:DNA-binding NarL/FixJ family response regulator
MRVLLVGQPKDRDRVRAELLKAGFEIVAESATVPDSESQSPSVDAIVTVPPESRVVVPSRHALGPRAIDDSLPISESLTAREHDVLVLLAEGLPNKAIAEALGISDQTVKFHVAAIIGKLGASNRTDAVRRAIRRGLVAI